MSSPEEIQQDIERTRSQLSSDVDRLTEKVTPGKVIGRQVDTVKSRANSIKDRFMGSSDEGSGVRGAGGNLSSKASDLGGSLSDKASGIGGSLSDKASGLSDKASGLSDKASDLTSAASNAPQALRSQAQGNPLAVGLIAFGVGWLLSSAAPASQSEQHLAAQAEAKAKQLAEPLKQTGQEMAQNLKPALQDSAQQIKSTATDAAQQTADHARSAADDVKQPLQQ